jgi:predicted dehydrogenase
MMGNRRTFLKTGAAGLLGLTVGGCGVLGSGAGAGPAGPAAAGAATGVSSGDRIVMGMIGVGGMGMNRLRGFLDHNDVEIAAICDVDARHLDEAVALVNARRNRSPKTFHDFRQLLEMPDIDAVAIVTPDHWHAIPTVRACEAGKDVFVEKPLSYSVAEGRAMVEAARTHARVTQMGNHIHNDEHNYRRVVERIRSGQLGRISRVDIWKTSATEGRGNPPDQQPPKELDYDFWLGPAPERPYNLLRSHGTFRHFWDYSGGTFIDFWCHIADVAYWALDLQAPSTISATGGRYFIDDGTETPDTVHATFEFPQLLMTYTLHPNPMPGYEHMGHIGAVFVGEDATLVTNYTSHEVYVDGARAEDFPEPAMHIPNSPGHLREFLDGVKQRNLHTTCNVEYGHRLSKVGLLANIAYRTESMVHWDDAREDIIRNPEARDLLSRTPRPPWTLST